MGILEFLMSDAVVWFISLLSIILVISKVITDR